MEISQELIKRINELAHKKKAEGLTAAEEKEQQELRQEYIKAFRENLRGQLENIDFKNPDGSVVSVKKLHDDKMGKKES